MKNAQEIAADLMLEANQILSLDPNPTEALYIWIDQTIGISVDAPDGGLNAGVDALPAFLDLESHKCHVAAVPMFRQLLQHLVRPVLCGLAKYETESGEFLEAIPLNSWPEEWRDALTIGIKDAFARADSDFFVFYP